MNTIQDSVKKFLDEMNRVGYSIKSKNVASAALSRLIHYHIENKCTHLSFHLSDAYINGFQEKLNGDAIGQYLAREHIWFIRKYLEYCKSGIINADRFTLPKLPFPESFVRVINTYTEDVSKNEQQRKSRAWAPKRYAYWLSNHGIASFSDAKVTDLRQFILDKSISIVEGGKTKYYIKYPLPAGINKYWITPGSTSKPDIADIVKDLCMRAGFTSAEVIAEQTNIKLAPKFEKTTYMDAINELCTVSGFEFFVDEDGKARFYFPTDREPSVTDKSIYLSGTNWSELDHKHLVSGSDIVKNSSGSTTYKRGIDYEIDLENGRIRRLSGSTIPNNSTVKVGFVYAGWSFREGEDIFSLKFGSSRRNIYGSIRVAGKKKQGSASTSSTLWDTSKVPKDKVLFADNQSLETQSECNECAARLKQDMLRRYTSAEFDAVGNPWLQVGDNIMIVESSTTISEVYKVLSISFELSPEGFVMSIKAFHVGYTPLTTS